MSVADQSQQQRLATRIGSNAEFSIPKKQRISYVLPNVEDPPRKFILPTIQQANDHNASMKSTPLMIPYANNAPIRRDSATKIKLHPRHALPVSALALDASTVLQHRDAPQGILYAGGRDGMISAWDLSLSMMPNYKRRRSTGVFPIADDDYEDEATQGLLDDGGEQNNDLPWRISNQRSSISPSASFRQCIGSHTDWINDIILCNSNQSLVSASSDGNINLWNPHDEQSSLTPQMLGMHSDYVRALTHAVQPNWIASGSFDRSIKLWDLNELRHDPIITINEEEVQSSIYSLATNSFGTLIAAASPEKIVKVWDPRSGKRVSQLIGHSDAVRKVLMSKDGSHLLTASSDSTIRLWSMAEQRCLHTFTHHNESVWSLYSDHPSLDRFYSGDRDGIICKVDWERCNEVAEGECVVIARDESQIASGHHKFQADSSGSGIHSIVTFDNSYIWTASASGVISRWQDVPTRSVREALYPIVSAPPKKSLSKTANELANNANSIIRSDLKPSEGLYGIPFDSLICLAPSNDPYGAAIGLGSVSLRINSKGAGGDNTPGHATLASASLISIPSALPASLERASPSLHQQLQHQAALAASPSALPSYLRSPSTARPSSVRSGSLRFASSDKHYEPVTMSTSLPEDEDFADQEDNDDVLPDARLAYEERELAIEAKPLQNLAEDIIHGSHGLIRSTLLNDRRHCLTVNSEGSVWLWDIIAASCLGQFLWNDIIQAAREIGQAGDLLPGEALDVVKERIQGLGTAPLWCTVDTKIGALTIHLEYPRCFDAEVYLDDCDELLEGKFPHKDDQRVNTARTILKSLFDGFIKREIELRQQGRALLAPGMLAYERRKAIKPDSRQPGTPGLTVAVAVGPNSPASLPLRSPLLPTNTHHFTELQKSVMKNVEQNAVPANDYFSVQRNSSEAATTPKATKSDNSPSGLSSPMSPGPSGGLMGRLKMGLRRESTQAKRASKAQLSIATGDATTANVNEVSKDPALDETTKHLQELRDVLKKIKPSNAAIEGTENEPTTGEVLPQLTYSPQIAIIISQSTSDSGMFEINYRGLAGRTQEDVVWLELQSPLWLLDQLFDPSIGPASSMEKDKLTFLLTPWQDAEDERYKSMPNMPTGNSRLTATQMLRIKKTCAYIADRLKLIEAEEDSNSGFASIVASRRGSVASPDTEANGRRPSVISLSKDGRMPVGSLPHEYIEILCKEEVIPPFVTLAQVQRFFWKSSTPIKLDYRWKSDVIG